MQTATYRAKTLIAILCISAVPLAAQQEERARVGHITFGIEGGMGAPTRYVNIYENGSVEINGERCAGCRWHAPYEKKFNLSAEDLQEVRSLFDIDALDRASRAPCTVQIAGQSRMREYISVSVDSASRSFDFVQSCTSPELKIVRDNLAIANGILGKAADAATADKPE
jgi:hypothetical protein